MAPLPVRGAPIIRADSVQVYRVLRPVTTFPGEERARRMANYRARWLSWRLGRRVTFALPRDVDDHWWHLPMRYADTGEPI